MVEASSSGSEGIATISLNEAMELIKGDNSFTRHYGLAISFSSQIVSLMPLIPFLTKMPELLCSGQTDELQTCSVETACQDNDTLYYTVDYQNPETVKNFVTRFDMVCQPQLAVAMFCTYMFLG